MALVRLVLHRLSCSNETVRNALKHEFWVQLSGSGAFVAKNSDATLFSELVC
jgi:DNA-binding GntR family transcriptional regulator